MNPFTDISKYNIIKDDNKNSRLKDILRNREIEHTYYGIEIVCDGESIVYKSRKYANSFNDTKFAKEYILTEYTRKKMLKRFSRTFIKKLIANASTHGKNKLTSSEIEQISVNIPEDVTRLSIGHIQTNGLHSNGIGTTPFYVFVEINDTIFTYIRNLGSNKKRLKPVDIHTMYYYTWKGLEDNQVKTVKN